MSSSYTVDSVENNIPFGSSKPVSFNMISSLPKCTHGLRAGRVFVISCDFHLGKWE